MRSWQGHTPWLSHHTSDSCDFPHPSRAFTTRLSSNVNRDGALPLRLLKAPGSGTPAFLPAYPFTRGHKSASLPTLPTHWSPNCTVALNAENLVLLKPRVLRGRKHCFFCLFSGGSFRLNHPCIRGAELPRISMVRRTPVS